MNSRKKKVKAQINNVIDILERLDNKIKQGKRLSDKEKRWFGKLYEWNTVEIKLVEMLKKMNEKKMIHN